MKKIVIAYVPVLHDGYRKFFERCEGKASLYILGQDLIEKFDYLYKEIRALPPEMTQKAIKSLDLFEDVRIADEKDMEEISTSDVEIIMPDEDIMRSLAEEYFKDKEIFFDSVFLRWDKHNTVIEKPVNSDIKISEEEFDQKMMQLAYDESSKSSDWWRRVGAVIVKDEKVILVDHNQHVPSEHTCYCNGDPRNVAHKGVTLELSTAIHAEASLIAEAAKSGISLKGAEIYVTTFPCPPCAKLIAYSGIKRIYYREGYGILDGEDILKSKGVEVVFVKGDITEKKDPNLVEYDNK